MTRICHFSSAHRGLDIRIFRKECIALAAAGFETHLVINATASNVAEAKKLGVSLWPMEYVPESRRYERMLRHSARCYTKARDINASLYHFHDPELLPYGLALAKRGKKVIFDAHEDLPGSIISKDWIPLPARRLVAVMSRHIENFYARRLAAVVAATPFIGSLFEGIARQVEVINNYPILDELSAESGDVPSVTRDSVCYVGGITEIRGIRELIRALPGAGVSLLLAGEFETHAMKNEVSSYPGWRLTDPLGFVSRQSVCSVMSRSMAGIVNFLPEPNHINSQPNKMFEYMSAGIPVIASNFPLWREVIEGNQCGICVDPSRPEDIAAAICYLRNHPDEVRRMGYNGRRAVIEKYNWASEETKLIALYDSLISKPFV